MKDEIKMSEELKNKLSEGMLDVLDAKKLKNATPSKEVLSEKENFALYGIKKNFEEMFPEIASEHKNLDHDQLADLIIEKISQKPENHITELKQMENGKNIDGMIREHIKDLISKHNFNDVSENLYKNKCKV